MSVRNLVPGVVEISVNNPGAMNALSSEILSLLTEEFHSVCSLPETRCIILRGAALIGDKRYQSTLAGADLSGLVAKDEESKWISVEQPVARAHMQEGLQAFKRIRRLLAREGTLADPEPLGRIVVIGILDGFCLAGGMELIYSLCDLVFATKRTLFGMPEVLFGGMGGWGGPQLLRERLGSPLWVKEILLGLGDEAGPQGFIDAQTALMRGLLNRIVEEDKLEKTALKVAQLVLKRSRLATTYNLMAADMPPGVNCTPAVTGHMVECMGTDDWVQGVGTFLDKTKK